MGAGRGGNKLDKLLKDFDNSKTNDTFDELDITGELEKDLSASASGADHGSAHVDDDDSDPDATISGNDQTAIFNGTITKDMTSTQDLNIESTEGGATPPPRTPRPTTVASSTASRSAAATTSVRKRKGADNLADQMASKKEKRKSDQADDSSSMRMIRMMESMNEELKRGNAVTDKVYEAQKAANRRIDGLEKITKVTVAEMRTGKRQSAAALSAFEKKYDSDMSKVWTEIKKLGGQSNQQRQQDQPSGQRQLGGQGRGTLTSNSDSGPVDTRTPPTPSGNRASGSRQRRNRPRGRPMEIVDPQIYSRHRRTIIVDTLPYKQGETETDRQAEFHKYMFQSLEMGDDVVNELGRLIVRRPPSKRKRQNASCEVICETRADRDCIFTYMGALTANKERARMYASYPIEWDGLRARRSAIAKEIRDFQPAGRQNFFSQIRYSDDQEGIAVWVRRVGPDNPWMPLKRALKKYEPVLFPPRLRGGGESGDSTDDNMETDGAGEGQAPPPSPKTPVRPPATATPPAPTAAAGTTTSGGPSAAPPANAPA